MTRKLIACGLSVALLFSLTACGGENTSATPTAAPRPAVTAEEQIALLVERREVWYQGGSPDYSPASLYYAVTDLNQNGRLEVLRSEYRHDTYASINRFYEVDPSGTAVVELPYDLADNGEAEASPNLIDNDLDQICFYRDGEYHYSMPTIIAPSENLDLEFFFVLSIDGESRVTTELLGEKWVNHMDDTTSYLGSDLTEISQAEYEGADYFRYEDYNICEGAWEWVMLLEGYDLQEGLTSSWEKYRFGNET